ncbi:MAG TPA: hypothetical protein VLM85_34480 [Polyangiaceae bacterium]|nr:hypothetical protein [Polyangiaceae bacterium]
MGKTKTVGRSAALVRAEHGGAPVALTKQERGVLDEPRTIHLFVQYESHQDFTYLGPVKYVSHEGEEPLRVRFQLEQPLTEALWKMWR